MYALLDPNSTLDYYYRVMHGHGIYLEHHVPKSMQEAYHVHPSVEVNFLQGCDMEYSFGGHSVHIPRERFCIFWGAQPHRVLNVSGKGIITNAYFSLEEFWSWPLPDEFVADILGGVIAVATETIPGDNALADRLAKEVETNSDQVSRLHCLELQARIMRMALSGWKKISCGRTGTDGSRLGGRAIQHFEKMLRFIALHYIEPITLGDVAESANVSQNYANTLFKKILGTTVKAHITNVRVYRARMLLAETNGKIITIALDSGFRSLSSFYEAFQNLTNTTPAEFRAQIRR